MSIEIAKRCVEIRGVEIPDLLCPPRDMIRARKPRPYLPPDP